MLTGTGMPDRRDVRSRGVEPDHTEPDDGRQPREHAVSCTRCLLPTLNISGICGRGHS